ncbi:Peptidase M23 [Segniliparus rotundus DSM 44985]|uniref:Peptidase M23 n=1 Tax=Segniliparus rotundus (strain ATCC BAA-972 / CDC 1076 / CIP 108378 / DSM 44985 / JCM 13578) TaxID=640132 RepID=D6Z7M8_SEGRD|nr:M23 family metallopeptidase [Segniliparus rotundus]ADG97958.1 Peptidase M23 [Segniliparus rotundus DSM 44985]
MFILPRRPKRTQQAAYTPFRMADIPQESHLGSREAAQSFPAPETSFDGPAPRSSAHCGSTAERPLSVAELVAKVHGSAAAKGRPEDASSPSALSRSGHRARSLRVTPVGIGAVIVGASFTGACGLESSTTEQAAKNSVTTQLTAVSANGQLVAATSPQDPVAVIPHADFSGYLDQLSTGARFSQEREQKEAANLRPMFTAPAFGTFSSGFGYRWGSLHAGADIAGAYGSPIVAVADGTVVEAGPASGFGQWIRIRHEDGTISVYGHISAIFVRAGQKVLAGDRIAAMGNLGFSTGTHLHLEIWRNGKDKVDPVRWLAARGVKFDGTPYVAGSPARQQ